MKKVNKIDRKAYNDIEKQGKQRRREMKARVKEVVDDHLDNMTVQPPKYPMPIHQNFVSFFGIDKAWEGKGQRKKIRGRIKESDKEPYFGKARRFGRNPDKIYKDRIKTFNAGSDRKFLF